jgi:Lrp/AsnC family leucine-responsive transcriptional regulator
MQVDLDAVDLHILELMQSNARIANVDLAKQLNMAPSAVLERVKKLEQKKVILQYNTAVNPLALNQRLLAFVFIRTKEGGDSDAKIAASLAKIPEVQEVHIIAGEDCFFVKIRTEDTRSLITLMRKSLKRIPNVISTKTTIVLETVKEQQQVVIPKN